MCILFKRVFSVFDSYSGDSIKRCWLSGES